MAKSLHVFVENLRLVPADPFSQETLDKLKPGYEYKVTITEDRSRGDLKLYWAGIGLLVANYKGPDAAMVFVGDTPFDPGFLWPSSRDYHEAMMKAAGNVTRKYSLKFDDPDHPEGVVHWTEEVDSIALDNMENDDFLEYWEFAQYFTVKVFGWNPWDEWKALHPYPKKK